VRFTYFISWEKAQVFNCPPSASLTVVRKFFWGQMRHLLIILALTAGLFEKAFSDGGNCVKYQVDVQLTDGKKIRGFVYVGGYEKKFQFKDILFLDYLRKNDPSDTLHIFRNIRQLKFPSTEELSQNYEFRFDATTTDNCLKIVKSRIETINVISYTTCNNCDIKNEEQGYYWNGIYPSVITELNKSEIDLLQTKPVAKIFFEHGIKNNHDGYWIISYSLDYKQAELDKIKGDFLKETNKLLNENKWRTVQDKYAALKTGLRTKKLIIFKIGFTE